MNVKHSIIALGAAGATAALVFGGSAVSTAFTSQSPQQADRMIAGHTGVQVDNGSFTVDKLVPGQSAAVQNVTIANTSNVPAVGTITLGTPGVGANGTEGAPDLSKLEVYIGSYKAGTLAGLAGTTIPVGTFNPGQAVTIPVSVKLADHTGNDWNGADVTEPWTATMTAGN